MFYTRIFINNTLCFQLNLIPKGSKIGINRRELGTQNSNVFPQAIAFTLAEVRRIES